MDDVWRLTFPTEPGFFWFHGWPFGKTDKPAETILVAVNQVSNGLIFIGLGNFMYRSEMVGIWKPAQIPQPPTKEEILALWKGEIDHV